MTQNVIDDMLILVVDRTFSSCKKMKNMTRKIVRHDELELYCILLRKF